MPQTNTGYGLPSNVANGFWRGQSGTWDDTPSRGNFPQWQVDLWSAQHQQAPPTQTVTTPVTTSPQTAPETPPPATGAVTTPVTTSATNPVTTAPIEAPPWQPTDQASSPGSATTPPAIGSASVPSASGAGTAGSVPGFGSVLSSFAPGSASAGSVAPPDFAQYQSPIQSGRIPDSAILSALGQLSIPNQSPSAFGGDTALQRQFGDLMQQQSMGQITDFSRQASQLQNTMDQNYWNSVMPDTNKGWGGLNDQYAINLQNDLANQQLQGDYATLIARLLQQLGSAGWLGGDG